MKNSRTALLKVALLTILSSSIYNCADGQKKTQQATKQNLEAATLEINPPKNIISLEQADAIYTNYSTYRIPIIEKFETKERAPSEKFEAARFVDFDYETIKNYIAFVDQEAKKAGVKKVTKLRLYFANYPNKNTFSDGQAVVHPRQNSIFILPTIEKDGGNYGFYIGDDGKAELIKDWKDQQQKGMGALFQKQKTAEASLLPNFFTNSSFYTGQSLTMNRGGGAPPPKSDF